MGARSLQFAQDYLEHGRCILEHLVVPEPQYPVALCLQPPVSLYIVRSLILMLAAVKLNNEFGLNTHKVCNVSDDYKLTAEPVVADLPSPQVTP